MRTATSEQLARAAADLRRLARSTAAAMERASVALAEADAALADEIVADSVRLDREREELARKAPGLRAPAVTVLATIHALTELERMSLLALAVARAVQRCYPHPVLPHELTPDFVEMGRIAVWLAELTAGTGEVRSLISIEDDLDDLRRIVADVRNRCDGTAVADVVLLSRHYERFADHAVLLGRLMKSAVPRSQATGTAA
ncbi:phosphate transport system regulatory protein PhoU [Amycolatopsis mongoliensis]|uniref:Phosphate transport system regulatory protein PhoU n=1 Tax=Amycolatopsis mongoliensis TaxID=715475 RepID=A0A9Y2NHP1_9PSEU|nr:PhoU domain-containing protein [Amycolatopsis sp. 4-36]WIX98394.1 phosphate transport system regulatory protein PhoU [Amycolatopsis sp. 4-36]